MRHEADSKINISLCDLINIDHYPGYVGNDVEIEKLNDQN